jgi:hypothetical protein
MYLNFVGLEVFRANMTLTAFMVFPFCIFVNVIIFSMVSFWMGSASAMLEMRP